MKREIKIFKTFEEQELYYKQLMLKSTPLQRLKRLLQMQQMHWLMHPPKDKMRKITIRSNGYTQQ
jgi:hypothetical protein